MGKHTSYSVVQFVPDPIAGEAVNLGVIAWDDGGIKTEVIKDWRRISSFAYSDIGFLRDFVKTFSRLSSNQARLPGLLGDKPLNPADLEQLIEGWKNSIQFTPIRTSMKSAADLSRDLAKIFIKTKTPIRRKFVKSKAVKFATGVFYELFESRVGINVEKYVFNGEPIQGKLDSHQFDVVVKNGKLITALDTLSFASQNPKEIIRDIDATAWKLQDVKKKYKLVPLCVMAVKSDLADVHVITKARAIFSELDTKLVEQSELKNWVRRNAKLPTHLT